MSPACSAGRTTSREPSWKRRSTDAPACSSTSAYISAISSCSVKLVEPTTTVPRSSPSSPASVPAPAVSSASPSSSPPPPPPPPQADKRRASTSSAAASQRRSLRSGVICRPSGSSRRCARGGVFHDRAGVGTRRADRIGHEQSLEGAQAQVGRDRQQGDGDHRDDHLGPCDRVGLHVLCQAVEDRPAEPAETDVGGQGGGGHHLHRRG